MADNVLFPQIESETPTGGQPNLFPTEPMKPKPKYVPETTTGNLKAAASGIPEGVAYKAGQVGDIESTVQSASPGFVDWAMQKIAKTGLISPEEAAKGSAQSRKAFESYNAGLQKAGLPQTSFPTSEELINLTPDALKYQPQNPTEERRKAAVSMGVQAIGGGGSGAVNQAKQFAKGMGSGWAAKGLEQAAEGNPGEILAGPLGAIAGDIVTGKIVNSITHMTTDSAARSAIAQSLAKDIREGKIKLSKEQIEKLSADGAPISIADIVAPDSSTAKMIGEKAGIVSDLPENANARNVDIRNREDMPRLNESRERTAEFFQNKAGPLVLEPYQLQNQVDAIRKAENDKLFRLSMNDPRAQNIYFSQFGDLKDRPLMRDAINEVWDDASPTTIKNEADWASKYVVPGVDANGNETPGNLAFWQKVKERLGDKYASYTDEFGRVRPGSERERRIVGDTMRELTDELKRATSFVDPQTNAVRSLYGEALDTASEGFAAKTAPEAGRKFYKATDSYRTDQFENMYNNYNDTQKGLFKNGYLSQMYDDIARSPNGYSMVADKMAANLRGFDDKAKLILGRDYDEFKNHIMAESVYNRAAEIVPKASALGKMTGPVALGAETALSGWGLYSFLSDVAFSAGMFDPNVIIPSAMAAVPGYLAGKGMQARARTVGNRVLNLVASGKPKDREALMKLADKEPMVGPMLERLNTALAGWQQQQFQTPGAVPTNAADIERAGHASGGKVSTPARAHAQKLIVLADSMKKKNSQQTESLLNVDDSTVAKALAVANKEI